MDKEAFLKRIKELAEIREKALEYERKEKEKAAENYIIESCPFKKGDRIIFKGKPGIIETIRAEYNGNFSYDIRFTKIDGKPYKNTTTIYWWFNRGLEKA